MKYFHRHALISVLAGSSILGLTPLAYAADTNGNFDVTITIDSSCTIDTATDGDVVFGSQISSATNIQIGTASIDVTCTQGTAYSIALNDGANANATSRRMIGQTLATDFVPYQLYSDAYTTLWGDGTTFGALKGAQTGTGAIQNHIVYGQVPSTNFSAQDYKDTVTATVTW